MLIALIQEKTVCRLKDHPLLSQMVRPPQPEMTLLVNVVKKSLSLLSVLPSVVGVAVAKSASKNNLHSLHSRRSCHSYMYSPAGWLLPYRHTLDKERNSSLPCDPNQGNALMDL